MRRTSALVVSALALVAASPASAAHVHRRSPRAGAGHRRGLRDRRAQRPRAHAAIIGGSSAAPGTFPSLAWIFDVRGEAIGQCTGTVVAPNLVLTAAHCAEDVESGVVNEPGGYSVVTGNVDVAAPSSEQQVSGVSNVLVYPLYKRAGLIEGWGDAALLELSTPTTAPPIALATRADAQLWEPGAPAVMAGWGQTYPEEAAWTEQLQWAPTVVQGTEWCRSNAGGYLPLGQLCTIKPPEYATGACEGDSGGPLLAQPPGRPEPIEIGIAQSVYNHCSTTKPSVFTRAELVSGWVNGWIEALNPPPPPTPPAPPPPPPAPAPPAAPPNQPGYYRTRPSKVRQIIIHVSGDGAHVVGMRIKMPVKCQHGYSIALNESWLSYSDALAIVDHGVYGTLEWPASHETKRGGIGVALQLTAPGILTGRLSVHLPYRNKRAGLCKGTLRFTADT